MVYFFLFEINALRVLFLCAVAVRNVKQYAASGFVFNFNSLRFIYC